jgi:DNA-binding PadR family transcriptional regulator
MEGPGFFGFGCDSRGRWRWSGFGDWTGEGPRRGPMGGRGARFSEQGDLKYVILRLLEEKPRHGYDIIKELENRFGGSYAPSPGTVYPTLTMLEDMGFARVVPEDGGKKIYEITDEGRKHLAEHSSTVDDIFARIAKFVEGFADAPMMEVNQAFRDLAGATYKTATSQISDKEKLASIRDILRSAVEQIRAVAK